MPVAARHPLTRPVPSQPSAWISSHPTAAAGIAEMSEDFLAFTDPTPRQSQLKSHLFGSEASLQSDTVVWTTVTPVRLPQSR
jgi:hypothetical protein